MGVYDRVLVPCPNCGSKVEFQSKVGNCCVSTFPIDAVPIKIAMDLDHKYSTCNKCKRVITIRYRTWKYMTMEVK